MTGWCKSRAAGGGCKSLATRGTPVSLVLWAEQRVAMLACGEVEAGGGLGKKVREEEGLGVKRKVPL